MCIVRYSSLHTGTFSRISLISFVRSIVCFLAAATAMTETRSYTRCKKKIKSKKKSRQQTKKNTGKNRAHCFHVIHFFSVITVITRVVIILNDLGGAWLRREKTATSIIYRTQVTRSRVWVLFFFLRNFGPKDLHAQSVHLRNYFRILYNDDWSLQKSPVIPV